MMPDNALSQQNVEAAISRVDVVILTLAIGLGYLFKPVRLFAEATRVLIAAMITRDLKGCSSSKVDLIDRLRGQAWY